MSLPDHWKWFPEARFGMFIHWGAYSVWGRGEQVLFRERLDQSEYSAAACSWDPQHYDPGAWADLAKRAGMKYAVLTTRHHDGYCLWDSKVTDYTTASQACRRDLVAEYADAFRKAGLKVGFYYSLADWRIPAYWEGPEHDLEGWDQFRNYVHAQVRELLTNYGEISVIWFDGAWPHSAQTWGSFELADMIRGLQPGILINNRLGALEDDDASGASADGGMGAGESRRLGDFGTPEHHITAESGRLWESCMVPYWRLWGYTIGERWRPADLLLDYLLEATGKGGNLLLNVGPQPDGQLPPEFIQRMDAIGRWMDVHSECVFGTEPGDVCEFITWGRQIRKGNNLYLVIRFWDGTGEVHVAGLDTRVRRATLITTGHACEFEQTEDHLYIRGLPRERPTELFPVIRLEFDEPPKARDWAVSRLWGGDPRRMTSWAAQRGTSVWADGKPR